ncbi:hypothetical protein ACKKBG_A13295 [Auxenochlorella protothecoides x Auxenochlorella symbiontica]
MHGATVRRPRHCAPRRQVLARVSIKGINDFDGSFELQEESRATLYSMLNAEGFRRQVSSECKMEEGLAFTGILFQPVPWSPATKRGMPAELEAYHASPDHTIINIPPTMMFKAKIFKPSRLCAIFRKESAVVPEGQGTLT